MRPVISDVSCAQQGMRNKPIAKPNRRDTCPSCAEVGRLYQRCVTRIPSPPLGRFGRIFAGCRHSIIGKFVKPYFENRRVPIMTLRKLLLPALAVLLLSSAAMRRAAQGQTTSTGLSGSWTGVVTLPPGVDNGSGGNTLPIMLAYNSNGTATLVVANNGGHNAALGPCFP